MSLIAKKFSNEIISLLKQGAVGVVPTDTIYGLVGQALNKKTVERIYKIRKRRPEKAFIILISSLEDLKLFDIKIYQEEKNILEKIWPGKVSVVLHCDNEKLRYLHRRLKTLAFRIPDKKDLRELISKTGPLVAPSANWEGHEPAKNIDEAKKYFGDQIDFYVDAGEMNSEPSTLIKIDPPAGGGKIKVLREGAVKFNM